MAARTMENSANPPKTSEANGGSEDVYSQLAQKDQDLILAAELGKALLQKNEELGRQNEAMSEEFAAKIEVNNNSN